MDTGLFGEGSIGLDWLGVDGSPGLSPQLLLKGKLVANGYGIGAMVEVIAEVTARGIVRSHAFLGATTPRAFVLNWIKQTFAQDNPTPPNEVTWNVELKLPMSPSVIEGLEERRQGKDFSLQVDTTILLIDGGEPTGPRTRAYYATHPMRTAQDRLPVSQHQWAMVLERWERGIGIPVLVPITAVETAPPSAEVVQHLKTARQKIDGGDYPGSLAEARKALELLRALSPAILPLPKRTQERDVLQRIHAVIDSLYSISSAPAHTDLPVKNFVPMRADAVAVAASTASVAQQLFAHLDR